jgi:hypothetical protein
MGVPGPAGVADGVTTYVPLTSVSVALNSSNWTLVLETPVVTVPGTYYVSATIGLTVPAGTLTECTVGGSGNDLSLFENAGPVQVLDSLTVTGTTSVEAGDTIKIVCAEGAGTGTQSYIGGNIGAVLVGNSTGAAGGDSYGPSGATAVSGGAVPKVKLAGPRAG